MKKTKDTKMNIAAGQLVSLVKTIVRDELRKQDDTCVCRIFAVHPETNLYDVYVEPDEQVVIHDLPTIGKATYEQGEFVYVYKIKNQLSNAFILKGISNK